MSKLTQEETQNLDATKALFAAFGAKDIPGIMRFVAPEIVIEFYGPPDIIPYAGIYRGQAAAQRFFETVLSAVDIHEFEPVEFVSADAKVVVTGHLHLTARRTGADIRSEFVHVIDLENGKWRRFRDFMDTSAAVRAFSGEHS